MIGERGTAHQEHWLDPARVRFYRSARGNLVMRLGEAEHQGVEVRRAFPLEAADGLIGFFLADGSELGLIADPGRLDPTSRQVLIEELDKIYFRPVITHIRTIGEEFGVVDIEVDTTYGPRHLEIRGIRDSIRMLSGRRALVVDVDGNRYELRDWHLFPKLTREILGL
ncbi:MAG: DUF1854 domain-containing protein [Candidatus Latescibacteria bacterium]|nr:DUF1854 domain-containing protein [Candidatus Latescibacterota bacterium]